MAPGVRWDRTGGEADGSGVIGDVEKVVGEDVFGGGGQDKNPISCRLSLRAGQSRARPAAL